MPKTVDSKMTAAMDQLLTNIKSDYIDEFKGRRIESHFSLDYEVGSKYIKVVKKHNGIGESVWGFVVNSYTDSKFRKGDLLMAASWRAPARNFPRGNVFENYKVRWVGTL